MGTKAALRLLKALAATNRYPFLEARKNRTCPLWLRLEYNNIDTTLFLRACNQLKLTVCIPPNRQVCSVLFTVVGAIWSPGEGDLTLFLYPLLFLFLAGLSDQDLRPAEEAAGLASTLFQIAGETNRHSGCDWIFVRVLPCSP